MMTDEMRAILVELALGVVSLIGVALLALLKMGVTKLSELTRVKLSDAERATIDGALTDAVAYAEEWARQLLRDGGRTPSGSAKLTTAVGAVRMFAGRAAQAYTETQLERMLEGRLARLRPTLAPVQALDDERVTLPPPEI